jgi:hypothetical protein
VLLDNVAITSFSLNVGNESNYFCPDREERVIGQNTPIEGLFLPRALVSKAEEFAATKLLSHLGSMQANWDGYGARKLHEDTIPNSLTILRQLIRYLPAPDIALNSNGTVSFEWMTAKGVAHLEIGKSRFSFFLKPHAGNSVLLDGPINTFPVELGPLVSAIIFPQERPIAAITKLIYTAGDERLTY